MVRSEMRQGVHTIYNHALHRMKQIDYHAAQQVRFSLHTYESEADGWIALDRDDVKFGRWHPAGTPAP